jgi:hypothetical protein
MGRVEAFYDNDGLRLCGTCRARRIAPSNLARCSYRCYRCRQNQEKRRRSLSRYNASEKRRAVWARYEASEKGRLMTSRRRARRIFVGAEYHSMAKTVEQAAAINAYIRRLLSEFVQGQRARAKAEGFSAGSIPPQAGHLLGPLAAVGVSRASQT